AQHNQDTEDRWLCFRDSGFPSGEPNDRLAHACFGALPLEDAAAPLVSLVRDFKPLVIVTYDEIGGYAHPDHLRTQEISVEAYEKSGDSKAYPGTGEPW